MKKLDDLMKEFRKIGKEYILSNNKDIQEHYENYMRILIEYECPIGEKDRFYNFIEDLKK